MNKTQTLDWAIGVIEQAEGSSQTEQAARILLREARLLIKENVQLKSNGRHKSELLVDSEKQMLQQHADHVKAMKVMQYEEALRWARQYVPVGSLAHELIKDLLGPEEKP